MDRWMLNQQFDIIKAKIIAYYIPSLINKKVFFNLQKY